MAEKETSVPPSGSGPIPVVVSGVPLTGFPEPKPVKVYKLKAGMKHVHDGESIKPGDSIGLNENQAKAFADKFDAADEEGFRVMTHEDLRKLRPEQKSVPVPPGGDKSPKIVNT